jgi:hypothetical protein
MRRTKITIERHEITVIRQRGKQTLVYCERCRSAAATFTQEEIAAQLNIPIEEIGNLAKTNEIHFIKASTGNRPLICAGLPHK